ncbi:MAG: class I SAM-dependent methyltransferase [Verrucomicrobiota bacterium]
MSTVTISQPELGDLLAGDDYVRQRLRPRWRDMDYLVLKDLRDLIQSQAPQASGRLFDYGCGAAPYRSFFQHCAEYVAADVTPGPRVDRLLEADGLTAEPSEAYDVVLSTQVLEHVRDPEAYLQECYRILHPGGRLILSTHGMVEEHGCPYDFHRWTSRGLENVAADAGFTVLESVKFTAEIRGIVQLLHQFVGHLRCRQGLVGRAFLAALRRAYYRFCMPILNWLGDRFPEQAVLPASHPATLYAGVCIVAEKPRSGSKDRLSRRS